MYLLVFTPDFVGNVIRFSKVKVKFLVFIIVRMFIVCISSTYVT